MRAARQIFADITASLFILLFVYAATSKLNELEDFKIQLHQSVVLTRHAAIVWWLIPSLEFVIALALIIPKTRLTGLYGAFGLMVLFTGYIIAITRYTTNVPCSCGGVLAQMTWNQHLIFNIIFIVAGGLAIIFYPFNKNAEASEENNNPGTSVPGF